MRVFKEVLGNIKDLKDTSSLHIDKVFLTSDDLVKKVIVANTIHNEEIGINLSKPFKDGDILLNDGHDLLYICIQGTDVLVIQPNTIKEMAIIAHNLGNRHMPAQFEEGKMIVPYDYLVEDYLKLEGVNYERCDMQLKEAFRHVDGAK